MTSLTPEQARLHLFVGNWAGDETLYDTPWQRGGVAEGFAGAALDLDGLLVTQSYRQRRDGAVSFKATGLFAHDTEADDTKLYWFDSLGFVPPAPATGRWDGQTLALTRKSRYGHSRYTYAFHGLDAYSLHIEFSPDAMATWMDFLTALYRRR